MDPRQATIARTATVAGHGLHGGRFARVTLRPAPPDHGIRFLVCRDGREAVETRLDWRCRVASRMNTALGLPGGGRLRTVEHLSAALAASGIDNLEVEVEGDEIPIFDGSARRWCRLLGEAGTTIQDRLARTIVVRRPVQVALGHRVIRLEPCDDLRLDVTCRHGWSGAAQRWSGTVDHGSFLREIALSRSSGRLEALWQSGVLAPSRLGRWLRHAFPESNARAEDCGAVHQPEADLPVEMPPDLLAAIGIDPAERSLRGVRPGRVAMLFGPWTLGGARYPDELVRHFALDLVGDLALLGARLRARVVAHEPTHRLTFAIAAVLHRSVDAWSWEGDGGTLPASPLYSASEGRA